MPQTWCGASTPRLVGEVSDELSASLTGLGPSLGHRRSTTVHISRRMHDRIATLQPLIDGTTQLVTTMAAQRDGFERGMNAAPVHRSTSTPPHRFSCT